MSLDAETRGVIEANVARAVSQVHGTLLENFEQLVSSKLESFHEKISENQKNLADSQLSKIKSNILSNDGYSFKRKSCEDQYKFNVKVLDKIQDAEAHLDKAGDSASIAAKEKISEGEILFFIYSGSRFM